MSFMNNIFKRTIPEQEKLFEDFQDPVEFIIQYISVFKSQLNCSTKVFLKDIPYYKKFQIEFINKVIYIALNEPIATSSLYIIEEIVVAFTKNTFYDENFCLYCAEVLLKGINIIISRCEDEFLDNNYANIDVVYKYTDFYIDFTTHFVKSSVNDILKNKTDCLIHLEKNIELINLKIENVNQTMLFVFLRNDKNHVDEVFDLEEYQKRKINIETQNSLRTWYTNEQNNYNHYLISVGLSNDFLGKKRRNHYDFEEIIALVVEKIKEHFSKSEESDKYFKIVEITDIISSNTNLKRFYEDLNDFSKQFV